MQIKFNGEAEDISMILVSAERYALGRRTYIVGWTCEIIKKNIPIENEAMYTAYDTYKGAGLPPGPICNPGIDAINAVLSPSESNYYYFCSNLTTREFFYAKTNAEHEKNLVKAGLK